jgi:hypothetical protein
MDKDKAESSILGQSSFVEVYIPQRRYFQRSEPWYIYHGSD